MQIREARMAENEDGRSRTSQRALIGASLAVAAAGAAGFLLSRRIGDGERISDAPDHVFRKSGGEGALVGRTVTINRPRQEVYGRWRDFTRFPEFMENVREVQDLGGGRSRWTIEAPAGTVELVTRMTEDLRGEAIAWESEPESEIATSGRVEFSDAGPMRGTMVRLQMRYDPPGGAVGRGIAKLLQNEPAIQARRDLRRFKQLMETGEVTTNASPSGRSGETAAETRI
jgi:uncharacterized membrane protein